MQDRLQLLDRPPFAGAFAIEALPVHEDAAVAAIAAGAGLQMLQRLLEHRP